MTVNTGAGFRRNTNNYLIVFVVSILLCASYFIRSSRPVSAAPNDVVINEIMYHPKSDNDDDEFLELYNNTANPIDLDGWCFTNGISFCFPSTTTIAANGYLVISPSTSQTLTTYGTTTTGEYTGKLSNSGETITLEDSTNTIRDTLTYDDNTPWPISPDGTGPSLELIDPTSDNSQSSSWGASLIDDGTPGLENTLTAADLPDLANLSTPTNVQPADTPLITIEASNATSVNLVYKVMFEADVTIAMNDDGINGDVTASDGTYSAVIPTQTAGSLVRYKVTASNATDTASLPGANNTINYQAYIVDDGQTADIPIVRWYMDPSDYTDMTTNHLNDDKLFPAVVAVGDQIFDNAEVRVKGQSSTAFPKRKYKFELPKGYTLGAPIFEYPIDKFSIQVYFLNLTDMQEGLAWKSFKEAGFKELQNRYVRVHKNDASHNSEFHGHYLLIENYDKLWRQRNGYDSGAMYKQAQDKKTRKDEDNSDIVDFVDNLQNLQGQELKDYLLDNVNVPAVVNYHATSAATFHSDWKFVKNIYQYRDTEGTGRWEYLPWDLDNVFLPSIFKEVKPADFLKEPITALVDPAKGEGSSYHEWALLAKAMYQFPEFRNMFFRRSISLYDKIWQSNAYKQWYDELYQKSKATMYEDYAKWNPYRQAQIEVAFPGGFPYHFVDNLPYDIDEDEIYESAALQSPGIMRELLFFAADRLKTDVAQARGNGELLKGQTNQQEQKVKINEIHYLPLAGSSHEFVELYNGADTPIDMSNWTFSGAGFTFPAGSVLPSHSYGVIVNNDTAFRAQYPSVLVFGEYSGSLSNQGEQLSLKTATGTTISSVNYGVSSPWPSSPNGQGYSLSLVRTDADESKSACWAPSLTIGGTPAKTNTLDTSWDTSGCDPVVSTTNSIASDPNYTFTQLISNNPNQESTTEEEDQKTALQPEDFSGNADGPVANNSNSNNIRNALLVAGIGSLVLISFLASKAYATIINKKNSINK